MDTHGLGSRIARTSAAIILAAACTAPAAGGVSVSLSFGAGFGCGPRYYRPYYPRYYACAPVRYYDPWWPHYGSAIYVHDRGYRTHTSVGIGTTFIISERDQRPRYQAPAAPAPTVFASASNPPPSAPAANVIKVAPKVSGIDLAWMALAKDDRGAMTKFGALVAREESAGPAHLGYAIAAARAGQTERAEWAARAALRHEANVLAKVPPLDGLQDVALDAMRTYAAKAKGPADAPARLFTLAVLAAAGGDHSGALAAAGRLEPGTDEPTRRLIGALGASRPGPPAPTSSAIAAAANPPQRAGLPEAAAGER